MAKIYIQSITKDFCLDLKQKETELLIEYRAEIDSLYQQCPINHEQIDETQRKIDLIEECSLKGAMVRSRTKFIENEETLQNSFTQQKLSSKNKKP